MATTWKRWICLAGLSLLQLSVHAAAPMLVAASNAGGRFLNSDGSVWATGFWILGVTGQPSPVRIFPLPNIVAVAGGFGGDFALLADGTLWGFGSNYSGMLGDGSTVPRRQPQPVPVLTGITAVSASWHVLALRNDGTVWSWGDNLYGQLGNGTRINRYTPGQISGLTNVIQVSAGRVASLALKSDGSVWIWGQTNGGAAGNGLVPTSESDPEMYHLTPSQVHNLDRVIAVSAGLGAHHLALRADGTVWSWGAGWNGTGPGGGNAPLPVQVPGLDHVIAIDTRGRDVSLVLKSDGTVWAWGTNTDHLLGVAGMSQSFSPTQVPGLTDIVAIAAGESYAFAMRRDGTVLAWGSNADGKLGDNSLEDRVQPQPVVGPGGTGQLNLLQPAPAKFNQLPRAQISLSASSGTAPLTVTATAINASDPDGTVVGYSWKTSDGQTATGASATFPFRQAGTYPIYLLIEDNAGGRGLVAEKVNVAPGTAVGVPAAAKAGISGNGGIALAKDGRILTWGPENMLGLYASNPQIPLQSTYSIPIANGITGAIDFGFGSAATLVLLADGTVLGWGGNQWGQAGTGAGSSNFSLHQPTALAGLPPVQALASGAFHSLALSRDGRVFAWGYGLSGQLGLGDDQIRYQPTEIPGLTNVTAIGAGGGSSFALKSDGTVWAWGANASFQLGDGTQTKRMLPIQIPGMANVTRIFAVPAGIIAQKSDGTVWVTGDPRTRFEGDQGGRSGPRHIPQLDNIVQAAGGSDHLIVLKADGTVWTGGLQSSGALGFQAGGDVAGLYQLPGVSDAIGVTAGPNNSMVVLRDGTVLSWGQNYSGQIGNGTLALQKTPVLVLNETGNGFLDLIPEIADNIPADKVPSFFVVASGDITSARASVSTTSKFNAPDLGKSGAVFVTAIAPTGTLASTQNVSSALAMSRATERAGSASSDFVLIQLTPSGWQQVVNGQLIPYASGVLGDQLASQTILDRIDTSNLGGAEFCVGYGASAADMLATRKIRAVATIPTNPSSGSAATATASCQLTALPVSTPVPVYRFVNLTTGGHFFTISDAERSTAQQNPAYRDEGIGFNAYATQQSGTLPVYRFYNSAGQGYFYTIYESEKDYVVQNLSGFTYQGIAFYAYPSAQPGTLPIYRFQNTHAGAHFFTIYENEKDTVLQNYNWFWPEGVSFYAYLRAS